jgi:hypothetical protein
MLLTFNVIYVLTGCLCYCVRSNVGAMVPTEHTIKKLGCHINQHIPSKRNHKDDVSDTFPYNNMYTRVTLAFQCPGRKRE